MWEPTSNLVSVALQDALRASSVVQADQQATAEFSLLLAGGSETQLCCFAQYRMGATASGLRVLQLEATGTANTSTWQKQTRPPRGDPPVYRASPRIAEVLARVALTGFAADIAELFTQSAVAAAADEEDEPLAPVQRFNASVRLPIGPSSVQRVESGWQPFQTAAATQVVSKAPAPTYSSGWRRVKQPEAQAQLSLADLADPAVSAVFHSALLSQATAELASCIRCGLEGLEEAQLEVVFPK